MNCKYKKFIICNEKCKWFSKEKCLLEAIEHKMEIPQAISEFKNAIDIDNQPPISNCIYCDTVLSSRNHVFKRDVEIYQVFCPNCHLRGPKGSTIMEAITHYNSLAAGGL